MIAANQEAAEASVTPTPSEEEIAEQLGVDLAFEPELTHVVSKMRATPLPPTWTAVHVDASIDHQKTRSPSDVSTHAPVESITAQNMEYVNRVTKARTPRHPGTAYFLAMVEAERKNTARRRRDDEMVTLGPTRPTADSSLADNDGSTSPSTPQHRHDQDCAYADAGGEVAYRSSTPGHATETDDQQLVANTDDKNTPSEVKVVYKEWPDVTLTSPQQNGADPGRCPIKRDSSRRGKGGKRRTPPPKWLVFTSWWNETKSGTENIMSRKHASIRYATCNGSFEVELEDVPAIFEVSHATGRHGKVETVDIHVGAQISILGRQMRLMQCDGLTAQWLEGEVRAITKAKTALVCALEKSKGDRVRVTCRSDRLELSASAQRGSGSVGQAAEMDRRALMQDVLTLRDILAETRPQDALRITEGLLFV